MTQGPDDDDASGGDYADDSYKIPAPGDWAELARRVLEANIFHMVNPDNKPVMIGRFEAIVRIGQGGFGTVFKARDPDLDRLVALKLCRPCSQDASDELVREAKVLARLDHPNIITIFELGDHDGAVFFAMPYVAGQNAAKFAERDPAPSVQEILRVYLHVARGLAAAHAEGVVHGDIKPSNFLLDRDDFVRIADFGLAKKLIGDAAESEQEGLWRRAGTLHYMAPEVLCGDDGDASSDQFSFFVALCQTLARGKLPFHGNTSDEVLDSIEHTDILQFLGPWVPAELKAVIRIGLSLDPSERFPDMETVEDELDRVLHMPPSSSPLRDEPESVEPGSDEPNGPERMHAPVSNETALPLGESPTEVPELLPLGGGPAPSRAKRGTRVLSASLVLTVGLTLGWLGRARVEGPRPSDDPVPLPSSPCALGQGVSADIDPVVLAVCTYIRRGQIDDADKTWKSVYLARWAAIESLAAQLDPGASAALDPAASATLDPAEAADKLAADTMIIVQTFQEWAKLSVGPDVAKANSHALRWTLEAEWASSKAQAIREKKSGRAGQPAPK